MLFARLNNLNAKNEILTLSPRQFHYHEVITAKNSSTVYAKWLQNSSTTKCFFPKSSTFDNDFIKRKSKWLLTILQKNYHSNTWIIVHVSFLLIWMHTNFRSICFDLSAGENERQKIPFHLEEMCTYVHILCSL